MLASAVLLGLSMMTLESPYWLALGGNMRAAYHSLRSLRHTELVAARDIYMIHDSINNREIPFCSDLTGVTTFLKLGTIRINRRMISLLVICVLLMLIRSISGIFIAEFCFGPELHFILFSVEFMTRVSIYAAVMMFRCMFCNVFTLFLDKLRRRPTIIGLFCGMCTFIVISSAVRSDAPQEVTIILYLCFIVPHFIAEVPIALYISEVFPLGYRGMVPQTTMRGESLTLQQKWALPCRFRSTRDASLC